MVETPPSDPVVADMGKSTKTTEHPSQLDIPKIEPKASDLIVSAKSGNEPITLEVKAHNDTHSIKVTRIVTVSEISKCIDEAINEISKSEVFVAKPVRIETKTTPITSPIDL